MLNFKSLAALSGLLMALIAAPARADDWAPCAHEGQTCHVRGEAMVRYGVDGRFVFRVTRNAIACTNDSFGTDPAEGMRKHCDVSTGWRQQSRYRDWRQSGSSRGDWVVCAYEGDYCRVPGNATVRYGAEGRYQERDVNGGIACNNGVFGDPLPGYAKLCEYRRGGGRGDNWNGGGHAADGDWRNCAREGGYCDVRGRQNVRYGARGRYMYREVRGGTECTNEAFGGDPIPGVEKHCEAGGRR